MTWIIGVDVGGTFTDFHAYDAATGSTLAHKRPSTPTDPAEAVLDGLDWLIREGGIPPQEIARIAHGTTVATNALIQRRGAPLALVTTKGFRDLVEIGRQIRPRMYDLQADSPPPLTPREKRFEVAERIGSSGEVVESLDEDSLAAAVAAVKASGVEACAVGLLFSHLNPAHEERVAEALQAAMPDLHVSLSSAVRPEFREYERLSTTVINAYLLPLVSRYVVRLGEGVAARAPDAAIGINQSSGGLMSVFQASRFPVRTALSGPAAGAVGARHTARLSARPNIVTLDMGGTSTDVCLVRDNRIEMRYEHDVADFPVRLPMVDINTVGAGGGSIAWFDQDGLLKVGPISAGADPGPACYGAGGTEPTVTDANLVLNRLSSRGLLGGGMALDVDAAARAIQPVAERLGSTIESAAHGIIAIVLANMVRAIRSVSTERGHDPRGFSLMPLGGAGPLHASGVARALGIREIVLPAAPGILCAQGLVASDLKEDFVASARIYVDETGTEEAARQLDALAERARIWHEREGVAPDRRSVEIEFAMRYVGQNFELAIPIPTDDGAKEKFCTSDGTALSPERLTALFWDAHDRAYGFHNPHDAIEIVNLRLTARGRLERPEAEIRTPGGDEPAIREIRDVYHDSEKPEPTPVYDRGDLAPNHSVSGPAIIEQFDCTTVLHPGDTAQVDDSLNILITVGKGADS